MQILSTSYQAFSWVQQTLEIAAINLAEQINSLSQGYFNFQPAFSGQNYQDLEALKAKFTAIRQENYDHGTKSFRAIEADLISSKLSLSERLASCWTRVERELRAHNVEAPAPPTTPPPSTPPPDRTAVLIARMAAQSRTIAAHLLALTPTPWSILEQAFDDTLDRLGDEDPTTAHTLI